MSNKGGPDVVTKKIWWGQKSWVVGGQRIKRITSWRQGITEPLSNSQTTSMEVKTEYVLDT
jgi:hypothetical protein